MPAWHISVEYQTTPATAGRVDGVVRVSEPGAVVTMDPDRDRTRLTFLVEETTLRLALDAGHRRAHQLARDLGRALAELGDSLGEPVSFDAVTDEELEQRLRRPSLPDLVGLTEAGEILGVSKQRVYQLATQNPDFPAAVAELASGKVYTRDSIAAFDQRWERRRTGRPRKDTT